MLRHILLVALVFSLGCVGAQQNNGLVITMSPDPPVVFQKGVAKVHVDVANTDTKTLENIRAEIFSPGILSYANEKACKEAGGLAAGPAGSQPLLRPQEFMTFSCDFIAPQINQDRVSTRLDARVNFMATFSAVQQLGLITEQEFSNRLGSTGVRTMPQSYTYRDRNIELHVEFSDKLPVVIKKGRQAFVTFAIRNIGDGFVQPIGPQDVKIIQKASLEGNVPEGRVLQSVGKGGVPGPCELEHPISPIGREFQPFSCLIDMPDNVAILANYNFIVSIRYSYEVRASAALDILR